MNNIFVLNKNYKKIGTLSNQGVKPQAPYYNDLYTQDLETGADTYQFSTISNAYTQDCIEIGNHIMFSYKNRNELFTITSLEHSHSEGYKTVGVYAESVSFELLDVYMEKPKTGSSSGGGMDNDNDGDDSTDDEYADLDDMYLDENGIIIYDKDGSGPPDKEDMYVDGNGIIIYKPKKKNSDRPSDSLEFKNISYPRFLSIVLKNTGWNYVCQYGLESNKQDVRISYDTNIFAILQDSIQSYKGVELEFVFEYNNGKVQKTIKAYKDGGRGSFVGKRFEYGTNVKGITKTQKVANSKDDTVLYVDDVGIEVFYDVDFALKSAEVPEIEIGDTHYVIDSDFHPPMQIKARIGKIEVSFTDPTKNKIYLANNKKISGSAVEDAYEDYVESDGSDHTHDRLVKNGNEVIFDGASFKPDTHWEYGLGYSNKAWNWANIRRVTAMDVKSYVYKLPFDREDMINVSKISSTGSDITKQDLYDFVVNKLNIYRYVSKEELGIAEDGGNSNYGTHLGILSEDFMTHTSDNNSDCDWEKITPVICWNVVSDTNNDGSIDDETTHKGHSYDLSSLVCALIAAFQQHVDGYSPSDPDNPGDGSGDPSNSDYIICNRIDVNNQANIVGRMDIEGEANVFGELYVTEKIKCELLIEANTLDVSVIEGYQAAFNFLRVGDELDCDYMKCDYMECDCIKFPDGSKLTTANINGNNSGGGTTPSTGNTFDTITVRKIQGPDPGEGQYNRVEFEDGIRVNHIWSADDDGVIHMQDDLALHNSFEVFGDISTDGMLYVNEGIHFADGSVMTTAGSGSSGSISGIPIEYVEQENSSMYLGTSWVQVNNDINVDGSIVMTGSLVGASALENIEFISFTDGTVLSSGNSISAISTLSELSEYATVEALQEEIRIKDEQIANLEARLATIEAMLGINNDN